ncbi:hypothetical protein Syun_015003 [Stephania yunnanensis]|uniref:Uncharacterized protein n=1 Tax=Stephania yunnanensis TaxID=152371 RepID=A0AAP0JKD6_9MAGN
MSQQVGMGLGTSMVLTREVVANFAGGSTSLIGDSCGGFLEYDGQQDTGGWEHLPNIGSGNTGNHRGTIRNYRRL